MPWSEDQHRLFEAAAGDEDVARGHGMTRKEARRLADEGVEKADEPAAKSGFVDLSRVFGCPYGR